MPGVFGLGGDVAGLSEDAKTRLGEHVAFYKQWRASIRRSIAHLLTPPALKTDREGWVALQLSDSETGSALLFVYRLNDGASAKRFVLRGLDGKESYQVTQYMPSGISPRTMRGAELMTEGLEVALAARYQAAVFALTPSK
jgi:alpha-galactosidase